MKTLKLINGNIQIINQEKPILSEAGAIVKVIGCGLCGSDLVKIYEKQENAILGHEVVGEIVEINTKTDFKVGDKIVVSHHFPCGECEFCLNKSYSMCPSFKATNFDPAGFSEYMKISEGHLKNTAFKLDGSISDIEISFTEPLACCIRAVERADLRAGARALTIGLGSIGILMAQAVHEFGVESYGVDVDKSRQQFAKNFGIKFDENIKYDAIFMTSGSSFAIPDALKYVKDGGKIIVFSSVKDNSGYSNNDIYYRELSIIASYSPSVENLKMAYNMLVNKKINVENISTVYNFEDIEMAIKDTISKKIYKAYIEL
jgi:L-iditol 2-dehydrogenase